MIEIVASDVPENYGNSYGTNLVLDDVVRSVTVPSVEALLFWRWADEPTSTPQPLGTATISQPFVVPFTFDSGREIELFAVAKTATGELSATNPLNGETVRYLPNLETLAPVLTIAAAVTNTVALVNVSNYSVNSRFRRIKFSVNSDMSDATITQQDASTFANGLLPAQLTLSKTSDTGAVHRYLTVEHSSNESEWGTVSATLDILYADSGGSGGGGSTETPPTITSAVWDTSTTVDLEWSAASGSGNYTIQERVRTFDGSAWGSWSSWSTLTSTEAATPYAATVSQDATYDKQYQYQIKRTSHADTSYSTSATVDIPATAAETAPTISSAVWDTVDTVDLAWSGASGSGNYTIQRRYRLFISVWSSWSGWATLTTSEAASPYADTPVYEDSYQYQYQYRIKRTSHTDAAYSVSATVDVP